MHYLTWPLATFFTLKKKFLRCQKSVPHSNSSTSSKNKERMNEWMDGWMNEWQAETQEDKNINSFVNFMK